MITREDVLKKVREWEPDFQEEWFETDLNHYKLASILDELGVDHPAERLEWYNVASPSIGDFIALANVEFKVITCEKCGDEGFFGYPKDWKQFQGVCQAEGYGPIVINDAERTVCGSCFGELTCW